jgi:hypothetical protein
MVLADKFELVKSISSKIQPFSKIQADILKKGVAGCSKVFMGNDKKERLQNCQV